MTNSLKQFYKDPYMHIRSFSLNAAVMVGVCVLLASLRDATFYTFNPSWWHALLIIPALYVAGMSAVWMHNASHGSFNNPIINDVCGYIAGAHQLWGYFGWKFIHMIHHMYSDRDIGDPHNPKGKTFWNFTKEMFMNSSFEISRRYREHWGDTQRTKLLQKGVMITYGLMAASNLAFWFLLLGPEGFVFFYIPSYIGNHLFYADINYACHPVDPETGNTKPTNLTHGWYHRLCNVMFFGIYYHGNHHRKPKAFNPKLAQIKT